MWRRTAFLDCIGFYTLKKSKTVYYYICDANRRGLKLEAPKNIGLANSTDECAMIMIMMRMMMVMMMMMMGIEHSVCLVFGRHPIISMKEVDKNEAKKQY